MSAEEPAVVDRPNSPRPGALRTGARADVAKRLFATASSLAAQARLPEAEAMYRRVLALDPAYAEARNNLGSVLDAMGRFDEAVVAYRRVIRLVGDHPAVHYNIGSSQYRAGHHEAAVRSLHNALALVPDYADAHNNLGNILRSTDVKAAVTAYFRAASCNPDLPMAHENLTSALYLLYETGDAETAAGLTARWWRDHPGQPLARHAAAAMAGLGHEERAADDYVRLLFDGFAGNFDRTLEDLDYRAPALLAEAVAAELGSVAPGSLDVLDAGCGTGLCGAFLRASARRLAGVDLSPGMLEHARRRGLYDALEEAELGAFLESASVGFDLIVAADVLCYFGPLEAILARAAGALRPGGVLAFTVERLDGDGAADLRLNPHGRYAHAERHVRRALDGAGLAVARLDAAALRRESDRPVEGMVVVARRSPAHRPSAQGRVEEFG